MKPNTPSRLMPHFVTVVLFTALAIPSVAQTTSPTPAPAQPEVPTTREKREYHRTDPIEEPVIELSPFEVSNSSDVGYRSSDSLAGTRIRTDLRDVGSSISVANEKFLSDIGATNSETLLQYMAGAEVGGTRGNFLVGTSVGDAGIIDEGAAMVRPQSNTRVRGLTSADNTRDYFLTDIPWDGYNVSRVELQRGPNSILFGNGSGGGIVNATTDAPFLHKSSTKIDARTDSFGSFRTSLNINQVLLKGELAIRVAGLNNEQKYEQKPAFSHDQRYFVAAKYSPKFLARNDASTSFTVSYENGTINANRPRLTTVNDGMFPWFLTAPVELRSGYQLNRPAGMDQTLLGVMSPLVSHAGYNPFVTNVTTAALISGNPTQRDIGARGTFSASNPNTEAWLGAVRRPGDLGATSTGNTLFQSGTINWNANYDSPDSSTLSSIIYPAVTTYYTVNSSGVRDGSSINAMRTPDTNAILLLQNYATRGVGSFLYALQGMWRSLTVTDPSVFDFYHKLLDGPNKYERSKFDVFNTSIEQNFFNNRLGFQLSYDMQDYSDSYSRNLNSPVFRIDPFRYLPVAYVDPTSGVMTPVVNPNFGRPLVASTPAAGRSRTTREVVRLTPYAILDLAKYFKAHSLAGSLLGRHSFTGLAEINRVEQRSSSWIPFDVSLAQATSIMGPNVSIGSNLRQIGTISYLGPSLANATTASGANLSGITAVQQPGLLGGPATPAYYFDSHPLATFTNPGAAFTPPAVGLAPSQVGGNATTQAENPQNYAGWGTSATTNRTLAIDNAEVTGERNLTRSYQRAKSKTVSRALVDQWRMFDGNVVLTGGLRKDHVDTYYPGDPAVAATALSRNGSMKVDPITGIVDYSQPFSYVSEPSRSYESDWMKTYGAVIHAPDFVQEHTPFKIRTSLFFGHSENFQPVNRIDPITGQTLAPPVARTREMGFAFSSSDSRFYVKFNWFETKVANASLPDNGVINFTSDELARGVQYSKSVQYAYDVNNGTNLSGFNPSLQIGNPGKTSSGGSAFFTATAQNNSGTVLDTSAHVYPWQPSRPPTAERPWTLQEWKDAEVHALASANAFMDSLNNPKAQQILKVFDIDPSRWNYGLTDFGITPTVPQSLAITGDVVSRGNEVELFFSPTQNWNLTFNVAKVFATRTHMAGNMAQWLNDRWALYNQTYDGADGTSADGIHTGLLAGGVRWFGGSQGNTNAAYARFGRNGYRYFSEFASREGTQATEIRPWRFTLVTSYKFTNGLLKGTAVGASYRWEDRSIIGYAPTETQPELFDSSGNSYRAAVAILDANKPYYAPVEAHVGLWASYSRKLLKKFEWQIQLNVNNVGENDHVVPVTVNPDGTGAAYRIAQGTTWDLRNTLKF